MRCDYNGKSYTIELDSARTTAGEVRGGRGRGIWYVTLNGTAVTSFDARAGETELAVCERLRRWLDEHQDMQTREDIHLGGG